MDDESNSVNTQNIENNDELCKTEENIKVQEKSGISYW